MLRTASQLLGEAGEEHLVKSACKLPAPASKSRVWAGNAVCLSLPAECREEEKDLATLRLMGMPIVYSHSGARAFCPAEREPEVVQFLRERGVKTSPAPLVRRECQSAMLSAASVVMGSCAQRGLSVFSVRAGLQALRVDPDWELSTLEVPCPPGLDVALPTLEPVLELVPLGGADCEALGLDPELYVCRSVLLYSAPAADLERPALVRSRSGDAVLPTALVGRRSAEAAAYDLKGEILSYLADWARRFPGNLAEAWEKARTEIEGFSFPGVPGKVRPARRAAAAATRQRATVGDELIGALAEIALRARKERTRIETPPEVQQSTHESPHRVPTPERRPPPEKEKPRAQTAETLAGVLSDARTRFLRARSPSPPPASDSERTLTLSASPSEEELQGEDEQSQTATLSLSDSGGSVLSLEEEAGEEESEGERGEPGTTPAQQGARSARYKRASRPKNALHALYGPILARKARVRFSPAVTVLDGEGNITVIPLDGERKAVLQRGAEVPPSVLKRDDGAAGLPGLRGQ